MNACICEFSSDEELIAQVCQTLFLIPSKRKIKAQDTLAAVR
jgi:hypothetical protein